VKPALIRFSTARVWLLSLVACLAIGGFVSRAHAQVPAVKHSAIAGRVLGPDGLPVAGVSVFVRQGSTDLATRAVTDEKGACRIDGLTAPAVYQVMCRRDRRPDSAATWYSRMPSAETTGSRTTPMPAAVNIRQLCSTPVSCSSRGGGTRTNAY
jgi:hypothetical protein